MENLKEPYISVVIPLYNKEKSIRSTIESVLAQTYKNYELIIVDDGSKDNSLEVVRSLVHSLDDNSFIRIIHKENGGVSSARNRGIMEAKGEYVAFLDGDDLWHRDFLIEMTHLIADYPNKSIYGLDCIAIRGNNMPSVPRSNYYRGEIRWDWTTMIPSGSSACVNKKDAIQIGLFDTRMTHGEDVDMWWRLILLNGGAGYAIPYAYYRIEAENRAMRNNIPLEKHIPYFIDKYADARSQNAVFRCFFDEQMIYRLYPYLFSKHYKKSAQSIARKFDYSQLKWSMHFRMLFPKTYYYIRKFLNK